ncbi:MAG: hypothetical protein FD189_270 [Elusimicrobia bacterium]|nr:MAG: hypothetical protein FD154_70 [Elusimicrobiota bacterium]KAF0158003.1 MAG: hypothetical protein FD189_270 [Elusimicrobiota bacterium]
MTRPMKCPNCGREIKGPAVNCPRCGGVFARLGPEEERRGGRGGGNGGWPPEVLPLLVAALAAVAWLLLR